MKILIISNWDENIKSIPKKNIDLIISLNLETEKLKKIDFMYNCIKLNLAKGNENTIKTNFFNINEQKIDFNGVTLTGISKNNNEVIKFLKMNRDVDIILTFNDIYNNKSIKEHMKNSYADYIIYKGEDNTCIMNNFREIISISNYKILEL